MLAKPTSLILVYIVTIFNIITLFSPIIAVATPFIEFNRGNLIIEDGVYQKLQLSFFVLAFIVSFLMLIYMVLDFLFGFSLRGSLKNCIRYEKIRDYDFLSNVFEQVKNKFAEKSVKLYVKNSDEINAFALSSLGSKAIVLTRGLINHYLVECNDPKIFLYTLRSIIGHEMSHLVNKDFLPAFLIITNQKVTNFVSRALYFVFNLIIGFLAVIPFGGRFSSRIVSDIYTILNFVITAFNRFVVYNLYEFLRRFISRSIEYRCDRQSAQAFGGKNMALALSMLGESGYFTLFSTHPSTKSRIKKSEKIKWSESVVRPGIIDSVANYFSLTFLLIICLCFAKAAHVDLFIRQYLRNHEVIYHKLSVLWHLVLRLF